MRNKDQKTAATGLSERKVEQVIHQHHHSAPTGQAELERSSKLVTLGYYLQFQYTWGEYNTQVGTAGS